MKHNNLLKIIKECSSSGSTSSANIATTVTNQGKVLKRNQDSIGVGFDPDGDYGIYEKPKKDKKDKK